MACKRIEPNARKVCSTDLRNKITIQFSSSKPNNSPNAHAEAVFRDIRTTYAMIKTSKRSQFIDGTNVVDGTNVDFYTRYDSEIDYTRKLWVEFNNVKFDIVDIENIDKWNRIVRLGAIERGNKSFLVNLR
jgi:hypothetical protein